VSPVVPQRAACFTCQAVPPNGLERRPKHGSLARAVPATRLMALWSVPCLSRAKFHVPHACPFSPAQKYRTNVWSKLWCNKVSDYTIIMYGNSTCCDRIAQCISASDSDQKVLGWTPTWSLSFSFGFYFCCLYGGRLYETPVQGSVVVLTSLMFDCIYCFLVSS
jgi:hypothetical protein